MKIYVKLLFARIQILQNELEGYKKWENRVNAGGLSSVMERKDGSSTISKTALKRDDLKQRSTSCVSKTSHKSTPTILTVGGLVAATNKAQKPPIHPSIDPSELEQTLVDLYCSLPSPSPDLIVKLLLILNAPLSKINPQDLLNSVKHERSKELLQKPLVKLLDQVSKREIYLEARIAHLEKELRDLDCSTGMVNLRIKDGSNDLIKTTFGNMGKLKVLKILEQNYNKLQDLEWKQDSVSRYLQNLEGDLKCAIQSLKAGLV
jgi:hypothetical protein